MFVGLIGELTNNLQRTIGVFICMCKLVSFPLDPLKSVLIPLKF